jgi:anaphase-promoting complex subunit 6
LGVLLYREGDYLRAEGHLKRALSLVPNGNLSTRWEPTVVNLAHSLRKLGRHKEALGWYDKALGLCPSQSGTYAAIGYTQHLTVSAAPVLCRDK